VIANGHRFDIRQGRLYFLLNQALLMLKPLVSHVGNEIDFHFACSNIRRAKFNKTQRR
jgi:hypothetical protein